MSEWQPIETAPLEVEILLFVPGFEYHGEYSERVHAIGNDYGPSDGYPEGRIVWTIVNDADCGNVDYTPHKPTLWTPLPELPKL